MSASSPRQNVIGAAAVVGALACWSIGPVFIKYLTGHFDVWSQNVYRYLAASLFLLPLLIVKIGGGKMQHTVWRRALLPAVFNVLMQTFWASSLYYVNPAFMSLLTKTSVLWTALFAMALFTEERGLLGNGVFWAGLVLSAAGVAGVILSRPDFAATGTVKGVLYVMLAAPLWSAYVVSARAAFRHTSSEVSFAVICLYTTVGLLAAALLFSRRLFVLPTGAGPWTAVVVSGTLCIGTAHVLYYMSQKRLGSTVPGIVTLASPLGVLLVSGAVLGERLLPAQWFWGAVLIAGALFAILARRRAT